MKNTSTAVVAVVGALVIGAVGFFVGRHTNGHFVLWNNASVAGRIGMMRGRGWGDDARSGAFAGKGLPARGQGEITKIDGNTLTLKRANGDTTTVTLANDAAIYTFTKGTNADLKVGQQVMIGSGGFFGTMQSVVIRP